MPNEDKIKALTDCKNQYQYYIPFIDKCIAMIQFESEGKIDTTELKEKLADIHEFSELITHFWDNNRQAFSTGVLEIILAYKRKLRLV